MGNNSSSGNRPGSALDDGGGGFPSRNPLQRGNNATADSPQHSHKSGRGANDKGERSHHAPPGTSANGTGGDGVNHNSRGRRVSVTVKVDDENDDGEQPSTQRLAGFQRLSSLGSGNGSFASHPSSLNSKPRLTINEARELLLSVFVPAQGQLECIASHFITAQQYTLLRSFWMPFLSTELREKWYLDAVMLSVLGKDRWRSSRQQQEIIMSVSPTREQVQQLKQQRRDYSDQLRERLLDLCGSLVESEGHHTKKTNLQLLLEEYNRNREAGAGDTASRESGAGHHPHDHRALSRNGSGITSSLQHQELLSLSLMRLQTTVSTSFDCFDLLAKRVPTAIISSLPSKYFLNSTPVVYEDIAFQEKKVGDLDTMSFFVSLESRRCMLNGQSAEEACAGDNRVMNAGGGGRGGGIGGEWQAHSAYSSNENCGPDCTLKTAQQFYAAVRHAGMVVTTANSSMILTVMFHIAEVLRARQTFRDNRAKAAQKGVTLEQLIGKKEATIIPYTGKHTEDLAELKRYAATDEMSLAVLTKLLIARFQKDNRAKVEKLRKKYPNLFAYLEAIAPKEEQEDFDCTRLLSGMVLKLMFLTGGGQRSIVADDRRVPTGLTHTTDDVTISNMLQVPILDRICWVACMMGMPIMSNHGILAQKHQGKPLNFKELDECCGVMRQLFQAVGALPCGSACPHEFKAWFPLFPFYAVNAEGKRILMYLYMAQLSSIQRVPLTIQKDMMLLSFADALKKAKGQGRVDVANYFFDPQLTVGFDRSDGEFATMGPETLRSTTAALASPPSPLSAGVNGSAAGKVMPASLSSSSPTNQQQAGSRGSPTKAARPGTSTQSGQKAVEADALSRCSSSSSASLSCSTLLEENCDIDVYTCVNPQTQLYMRCSNEATTRRHRATELTPSVTVTYLHSASEAHSRRPDVWPALHQAVPKLMPSEGFLVIKWTSAEPLVTVSHGDILSVMAERVTAAGSAGGGSGKDGSQARGTSARYFTGATRPNAEDSGAAVSGGAGGGGGASPSSTSRVHTVTVDGSVPGVSAAGGGGGGGGGTHGSGSNSSFHASEKTRVYLGLMNEFLGTNEKVSSRVAVRWSVLEVFSSSQLAQRSRRLSAAAAAGSSGSKQSGSQDAYRHELVLHVSATDMAVSGPLRVLTIGHERASMSVFSFISPDSDSVCWANPQLIDAIVNRHRNNNNNSSDASPGMKLQSTGNAKGPSGVLCNTEEELHNVFFSIGVLLSNAIVNGVYFSAPIAPLAFLLMKKALSSGDYSFKSFMWLEPADGNLLSPALVLNSAYEILTMSETQYVSFLESRGLTRSDTNIFPVIHSLADEMREDRAWESMGTTNVPPPPDAGRMNTSVTPSGASPVGSRSARQQSSKETNSLTANSVGQERSLNGSRLSSSTLEYMKLIHVHNRQGSTFHRSQGMPTRYGASAAGGGGSSVSANNNPSAQGNMAHNYIMSSSVPVQDRLQGYRSQQQQQKDGAPSEAALAEELYAKLPSRREYLNLYLVNDLAWGSVKRDGLGEKNKELWVSMARGFMTSGLAKSPLMTNCCSRIIREVLCVPRADE